MNKNEQNIEARKKIDGLNRLYVESAPIQCPGRNGKRAIEIIGPEVGRANIGSRKKQVCELGVIGDRLVWQCRTNSISNPVR